MKYLLFGGDNGFKNVGDQAMLAVSAQRIRKFDASAKLLVLTVKKETTFQIDNASYHLIIDDFLGMSYPKSIKKILKIYKLRVLLQIINIVIGEYIIFACKLINSNKIVPLTKQQQDFINLLNSADVFVNYGSGGINEIFGGNAILRWSLIYRIGARLKKKIIVTGQGIGPLYNWGLKFILKRAIKYVNLFGIRDKLHSKKALLNLSKYSLPRVEFSGDDAWLLEPKIPNIPALEREAKKIGIHLRGTDYVRNFATYEIDRLADFLEKLVKKTNATLFFIPMCFNPDEDDREFEALVGEKVKTPKKVLVNQEFSPAALKAIVGAMDLNIGFSYHFILFSLTMNVPGIAFYTNEYYKTKHESQMNLFDDTDSLFQFSECDLEKVIMYAENSISLKNSKAERLRGINHRYKKEIENFNLLFEDSIYEK